MKMLHCGYTSDWWLHVGLPSSPPQGRSGSPSLWFMNDIPHHSSFSFECLREKSVMHLKTLRKEKKPVHVTFSWQPSKVVEAIRTRRPSVCLAVICSWSPRLPTTPWVSCIMQQQFWLKSKNLLTECSVRHLGRCLINYYNWHPHQMSDIWRPLCW